LPDTSQRSQSSRSPERFTTTRRLPIPGNSKLTSPHVVTFAETDIHRTTSLREKHKKALPSLLQSANIDYLKDVYPFHPALIEMLIDISSLMQRERTALRLLYELLVVHYPELPLGQFLPVGSAFEAIFPPQETPQGRKKLDDLQSIHRLYYERFRPAMHEMLRQAKEDEAFDFDTLRLKENNVRIGFRDTSSSGGFSTNDWEIRANDSEFGGLDYLGLVDVATGLELFKGYSYAEESSNDGSQGLLGALVVAVVDQIVDSTQDRVHDLSRVANYRMVWSRQRGFPPGPRFPVEAR